MQIHVTTEQAPIMAAILAQHGEILATAQGDSALYISTDRASFDLSRAGTLDIIDGEDGGSGLTPDARKYLATGCGDHSPANHLPDGQRHYNAVQELLRLGFIEYGRVAQRVTDLGRRYYEQTKGA